MPFFQGRACPCPNSNSTYFPGTVTMRLNMPARPGHGPLTHHRLRLTTRCLLLLSSAHALDAHAAEHVAFNPAFFADRVGGLQVDISKFSQGNIVLPGNYRTDVHLNGQWIGRETVSFAAAEGQNSAQLCLAREALLRFGVDLDAVDRQSAQAGVAAPSP